VRLSDFSTEDREPPMISKAGWALTRDQVLIRPVCTAAPNAMADALDVFLPVVSGFELESGPDEGQIIAILKA
jgi:hypothetical protein